MEKEETKKCFRCEKDLPATDEFFYKDAKRKDGFRSWCKDCTKKAIANTPTSKIRRKNKRTEKTQRSAKEPLTTASPEAIIAALRKGVAREIIELIEKSF